MVGRPVHVSEQGDVAGESGESSAVLLDQSEFCHHASYLMPVVAMPLTRNRWPIRKARNTGSSETIDMANIGPQVLLVVASTKDRRATGTVYMSGSVWKISWP